MSYQGVVSAICRGYLSRVKSPRVLEIGTDRGQTTLPMLQRMIYQHGERGRGDGFLYCGVDIRMRREMLASIEQFTEMFCLNHRIADLEAIGHIRKEAQQIAEKESKEHLCKSSFYQSNSLQWLALHDEFESTSLPKYDLVLLDGDHNYYTVRRELDLLERLLLRRTSIVVIDDFMGKWGTKDMWYSEKTEYKENTMATVKVENTEDQEGVQNAVLDFIRESELPYNILIPDPKFEPAIMYRSDVMTLEWAGAQGQAWASCNLVVKMIDD